ALLAGGPDPAGVLPSVWIDDARAMTAVLDHLRGLGHERIAHVSGPAGLLHTARRRAAFGSAPHGGPGPGVAADFTDAEGARATSALLAAADRPTAIVYDNDVMAVAGLSAARQAGLAVPADLSIVSWEDASLCRVTHPTLAALSRDAGRFGSTAAARLLSLLGPDPAGGTADTEFDLPALVPRESTAPPPR